MGGERGRPSVFNQDKPLCNTQEALGRDAPGRIRNERRARPGRLSLAWRLWHRSLEEEVQRRSVKRRGRGSCTGATCLLTLV